MKTEVKNLLNQPKGSVESYSLEIIDLPIDEAKAQITGEAVLTNLGEFILAQITGQATLTQPCSRCLKEATLTIPLNFSKEFKEERSLLPGQTSGSENHKVRKRPSKAGGDSARDDNQKSEETYSIEDGKIDLAPPLTEEIIANIPIKVLCRTDCRGLCPICGNNLNDNPCKCDKVEFEVSNKIRF